MVQCCREARSAWTVAWAAASPAAMRSSTSSVPRGLVPERKDLICWWATRSEYRRRGLVTWVYSDSPKPSCEPGWADSRRGLMHLRSWYDPARPPRGSAGRSPSSWVTKGKGTRWRIAQRAAPIPAKSMNSRTMADPRVSAIFSILTSPPETTMCVSGSSMVTTSSTL